MAKSIAKLEFGSLRNSMLARTPSEVPKVGMGATQVLWTDRVPFTVVEVISETEIVVQEDRPVRADKNGMSETQSYLFEPAADGDRFTLHLIGGAWRGIGVGDNDPPPGSVFVIGVRECYYDYSF